MSICFTICSSVSSLLLVLNIARLGTTGPLASSLPLAPHFACVRSCLVFFFCRFSLSLFSSACCCPLHISLCTFLTILFGLVMCSCHLSLVCLFLLSSGHDTYKYKPTRHLITVFSSRCFSLLVLPLSTLALLQGWPSLYTHRPTQDPGFFVGAIQYCHIGRTSWPPMLMLLYSACVRCE